MVTDRYIGVEGETTLLWWLGEGGISEGRRGFLVGGGGGSGNLWRFGFWDMPCQHSQPGTGRQLSSFKEDATALLKKYSSK